MWRFLGTVSDGPAMYVRTPCRVSKCPWGSACVWMLPLKQSGQDMVSSCFAFRFVLDRALGDLVVCHGVVILGDKSLFSIRSIAQLVSRSYRFLYIIMLNEGSCVSQPIDSENLLPCGVQVSRL